MKNNIYACLEIGNAEARIMVCNIRDERLYVLSQQTIEADGIESGKVINVNQIVQNLKTLKANVENDLNQTIKHVLLSIPAVDVNIENVTTSLELDTEQPIDSVNIKELFRRVISQPVSENQVVVSILPREFKVDSQNAIQNPHGKNGQKLTMGAQKILAPATMVYNFINIAELAGFRISDISLGSMVEALYIPNSQQTRRGMCHVNIGKATTTITVLHSGNVDSTKAWSFGGQDITNDIKESFKIDEKTAEMLKLNFGRVKSNEYPHEIIYVNEVEGELICITRQMLEEIITMRYEKFFKVIKKYLNENAYKSGEIQYVLTGGASEIEGGLELAKEILGEDARVYRPSMLGVRHAKFARVIGMAIYAHEMALLTEKKSNIIDLNLYEDDSEKLIESHNESSIDKQSEPVIADEKSFMDHKFENSGVLERLFDKIFDEKAK